MVNDTKSVNIIYCLDNQISRPHLRQQFTDLYMLSVLGSGGINVELGQGHISN